MYIYVYMYIYIYAHIHTRTHKYTHSQPISTHARMHAHKDMNEKMILRLAKTKQKNPPTGFELVNLTKAVENH